MEALPSACSPLKVRITSKRWTNLIAPIYVRSLENRLNLAICIVLFLGEFHPDHLVLLVVGQVPKRLISFINYNTYFIKYYFTHFNQLFLK